MLILSFDISNKPKSIVRFIHPEHFFLHSLDAADKFGNKASDIFYFVCVH